MCQIIHQRGLAQGLSFDRKGMLVHIAESAIFGERERVELDFVVSSREVGRQFTAQQFAVAARQEDVDILPKQSVDEQMPLLHILDFVHKKVFEVAVKPVKCLKQRVKVGSFERG